MIAFIADHRGAYGVEPKPTLNLGSDSLAVAPFTDAITYPSEGDWAVLTRERAEIRDATGAVVERPRKTIRAQAYQVDTGEYRHFRGREIYEQPEILGRALARNVDLAKGRVRRPESPPSDFAMLSQVTLTACDMGVLLGAGGALLVRADRPAGGGD